jgi:uncharacterized OB-fold protein
MSDEAVKCPSCGGEIVLPGKKCPRCGRWPGARGISFYVFWTALSLVVVVLLAVMFHVAFQMVNRML